MAFSSYSASVIMSMCYGKTTPSSYSDPEIREINDYLAFMMKVMSPGGYLVDSYPILRYVPGYGGELKRRHQKELALFRRQLDGVREKMVCSDTFLGISSLTRI